LSLLANASTGISDVRNGTFLNSGLARWERDSQVCAGSVTPLAPFTLTLTDLAVAMLDASSSVPPELDPHLFLGSFNY
jgi:hypothetical protein